MVDRDDQKKMVKRREIGLRREGRLRPVFVSTDAHGKRARHAGRLRSEVPCRLLSPSPLKGNRRRAPVFRRRRRSFPAPGLGRVGQARAPERTRRHSGSGLLQPQHADRSHQRLRRLVPFFCSFAKLKEGDPAPTPCGSKKRGASSKCGWTTAVRDPHRERSAPGSTVLVLRGAASRIQAHQTRRGDEVLTAVEIHFSPSSTKCRTKRCDQCSGRAGPRLAAGGRRGDFHPRCGRAFSHDKATADHTSRCTTSRIDSA